jgi:hypothetical protein
MVDGRCVELAVREDSRLITRDEPSLVANVAVQVAEG